MIIQCKNEDIETVFDYIGEDYGKCLYIFIDLKKFGLDDENFDVWIQYNKEGAICAIISEYFGGIQIYSREENLILEEIADFIKEKATHVLFAIKPIIDRLKPFLPGYEQETGTVGELMELKYPPNPKAYSAPMEELAEIVRIVADDEGIGKPYGYDSLYEQYTQRKTENFNCTVFPVWVSGNCESHSGCLRRIYFRRSFNCQKSCCIKKRIECYIEVSVCCDSGCHLNRNIRFCPNRNAPNHCSSHDDIVY